MTCPTCSQPMLCGESGWVCGTLGCEQRILPNWDDDKIKPAIKHNKTPQQRGDQMAEGLKGLDDA